MQTGENQETTREDVTRLEDVEDTLVDVLPFLLSGDHLREQRFYRVHIVHSYTRDVLAILVGVGLGFPGAKIFEPEVHADLGALLAGLPWYEWAPCALLILILALVKTYVVQESVEKRAHNVDELQKNFGGKLSQIESIITKEKPLDELRSIKESVNQLVQYHTQERSYTFSGGKAPGTDLEAKDKAKRYCHDYARRWK